MASEGLLSMVGTPIGNLSDASPRAVETLRDSDVILCEDTRVTARLLAHFGIRVPLQRADENVLARRIEATLGRLASGEHVSFVSDAGMPGVSDPGQRLVDAALDAGIRVEVIPGPSAVICALVASGLPMERFFFEGFLPRKRGAQLARLRELAPIPATLVLYESPHRVVATLAVLAEVFPLRRVALVRELTKLHEEVVRGRAPEVASLVSERAALRGECVLVVEGPVAGEGGLSSPAVPATSLDDAIAAGLSAGEGKARLAKRLSRELGLPRSEVYDRIVGLSDEA
ncbi:MAG: 16S rRNA (cytidine(1402)-2'-O)-methyltransferase [Acidobacteriota bacterium]|nr:16S rRNA (cytidine(1402)-2'-O)-methyltransferase [Acidobacteriota bacterium]